MMKRAVRRPVRARRNPFERFEETLRDSIELAVNTVGFAGVLDILADEAAERAVADPDDEAAGRIVDAIETALEEITECECDEGDSDDEDDEDEDDEDEEDPEV